MYGLLLENLAEYVKTVYGEEKWDEVRRQVGTSPSFGVHDDYDENLLMKLASAAHHVSFNGHTILKFQKFYILYMVPSPQNIEFLTFLKV